MTDPRRMREIVEAQLEEAKREAAIADMRVEVYRSIVDAWKAESGQASTTPTIVRATKTGNREDMEEIYGHVSGYPSRVFGPTEIAREIFDSERHQRSFISFRAAVSRAFQALAEEGRMQNLRRGKWRVILENDGEVDTSGKDTPSPPEGDEG